MQTTHSELPGPSTGLGAEGVTGVPGVSGGLGTWKAEALGSNGGDKGAGAVGPTSSSSSCWTALQAPDGGGDHQWTANRRGFLLTPPTSFNSLNIILHPSNRWKYMFLLSKHEFIHSCSEFDHREHCTQIFSNCSMFSIEDQFCP